MASHAQLLRQLLTKYGYRKTLKYLEYAYDLRKGVKIDQGDESIELGIRTIQLLERATADNLEHSLETIVEKLNNLLALYAELYAELENFNYDIDDYTNEHGDLPGNMDEDTFITQLVLKSL
jgi:uncharacterized protein YpmS